MVQWSIIGACFAVLVLAVWQAWFVRRNRMLGRRVLSWLQAALLDYGQLCGVSWTDASHFRARLSLEGHSFYQPVLEVCLAPRHRPLLWLLWWWRKQQETLTFRANLACPPSESLEINRMRWSALNRRVPFYAGGTRRAVSTLFISTLPSWQPQLSGRIKGVVAARDFEFLGVAFQSRPPHFSATFPLEETLRHPSGELAMFRSLRELAQGSPTSRM